MSECSVCLDVRNHETLQVLSCLHVVCGVCLTSLKTQDAAGNLQPDGHTLLACAVCRDWASLTSLLATDIVVDDALRLPSKRARHGNHPEPAAALDPLSDEQRQAQQTLAALYEACLADLQAAETLKLRVAETRVYVARQKSVLVQEVVDAYADLVLRKDTDFLWERMPPAERRDAFVRTIEAEVCASLKALDAQAEDLDLLVGDLARKKTAMDALRAHAAYDSLAQEDRVRQWIAAEVQRPANTACRQPVCVSHLPYLACEGPRVAPLSEPWTFLAWTSFWPERLSLDADRCVAKLQQATSGFIGTHVVGETRHGLLVHDNVHSDAHARLVYFQTAAGTVKFVLQLPAHPRRRSEIQMDAQDRLWYFCGNKLTVVTALGSGAWHACSHEFDDPITNFLLTPNGDCVVWFVDGVIACYRVSDKPIHWWPPRPDNEHRMWTCSFPESSTEEFCERSKALDWCLAPTTCTPPQRETIPVFLAEFHVDSGAVRKLYSGGFLKRYCWEHYINPDRNLFKLGVLNAEKLLFRHSARFQGEYSDVDYEEVCEHITVNKGCRSRFPNVSISATSVVPAPNNRAPRTIDRFKIWFVNSAQVPLLLAGAGEFGDDDGVPNALSQPSDVHRYVSFRTSLVKDAAVLPLNACVKASDAPFVQRRRFGIDRFYKHLSHGRILFHLNYIASFE